MKFHVEYISKDAKRPYLIARQLGSGTFTISSESRLGGTAIKPYLSQPRALTPEGKPDLTVFVFTIASADDLSRMEVGTIVELE